MPINNSEKLIERKLRSVLYKQKRLWVTKSWNSKFCHNLKNFCYDENSSNYFITFAHGKILQFCYIYI